MPKTTIKTYAELERLGPTIVAEYGSNSELATAALANPILALEAAGYTLAPKVRTALEGRLRFGEANFKRRLELQRKITKTAGEELNPDDDKAVFAAIDRLAGKQQRKSYARAAGKSTGKTPERDVLEDLREAHAVVPLLLEYRALTRAAPRFATPAEFERLRKTDLTKRGDIRLSNVKIYYPPT